MLAHTICSLEIEGDVETTASVTHKILNPPDPLREEIPSREKTRTWLSSSSVWMPFIAADENMDSIEIPARTAAPAVATVNLSGPPLIIITACVSLSHCLASADSPENNCQTWCNGDPNTRRKQTPWKPLRSHAIRDHCCNYRARFSPAKTCTSSASATHGRRTATRRSTLGFTGCGSGQASSKCRLYSTLNSCCGNALSYVCVRARARVEEQLQQPWRHLWLLLLHRFPCRYPRSSSSRKSSSWRRFVQFFFFFWSSIGAGLCGAEGGCASSSCFFCAFQWWLYPR